MTVLSSSECVGATLRILSPCFHPHTTARFEAIFATLAAAGWPRANLTLAWDFTTATKADITGRIVAMRDDALRRFGTNPKYYVTSVTENPRDGIARQIQGVYRGTMCVDQAHRYSCVLH